MERSTPVRKSHTSTADLLVWTETPPAERSAPDADGPGSRPGVRSHQPSGGISAVLYGVQLTDEEAESAMKSFTVLINHKKPCSDYKLREITGSGIFSADKEEDAAESGGINSKTGLRLYQKAASTISQISFVTEESVSPKKPVSIAEVAKQRELSGSLETETESRLKKQISDAKCKVLIGHDIFAPPPEIPVRPLAARNAELQEKDIEPIPRNLHTYVKVSNKIQSTEKLAVVFVLGGPGSGKGTQCANIVEHFGFTHLSAGDLLRAEIKSGSENGTMIQNMIKEGKIVPSEVTIKLLQRAMLESGNNKFLIDGFPRNEENRAAFEEVTKIEPEFVLFFDCPEEEMERRVLSRNQGRDDDNIETIRKRFKVYVESSIPVVEYYESKGKVQKVDAAKPVSEVFESVKSIFAPFS